MAMVVESSTQVRGCAELAHDVRIVVKHTFLELIEDDEFGGRSAQNARQRASSEPRKMSDHMVQFDNCEMERTSAASTQANDTDDDIELILSDDEEPEMILIDDEEPATPLRAPLGVASQVQPQLFVPVCVAFVPVMKQPVKKSSRTAIRRRQRAMNRWFRHNMQNATEGEQKEGAFDHALDAEFSDEWQLPESDAESPEIDAAESWPIRNSSPAVSHDKKKTDLLK